MISSLSDREILWNVAYGTNKDGKRKWSKKNVDTIKSDIKYTPHGFEFGKRVCFTNNKKNSLVFGAN